jgi:lysophospholipase L1-like esterase
MRETGSRKLAVGRNSSKFKVQSSKFGVQCSKFEVQSSKFRYWLLATGNWRLISTFLFLIPYSLLHISYSGIHAFLYSRIHALVTGRNFFLLPFAFCLLPFFLLINEGVSAQTNPYLYQVNQYNFIRYDLNEMHHFGNDSYSAKFFAKLEKLVRTGEGRINVVQIGGSHIQAGTFSGQIRSRLQQMNGEINAGWGFMFPYRIARTNSPFGYFIRFSGDWQSCRNVETRKNCTLGVSGISASTTSQKAELTILLEPENVLDYSFNKIRVFYENRDSNYTVSVDSTLIKNFIQTSGYIDFELNTHVDSLNLVIQKKEGSEGRFTLYGISTESAPNGFLYHSIGVNGAHVPAFLRCDLFEEQLALLKPDLVILGLGINDAYGRRFSQSDFESNYGLLISRIRKSVPETAIIFTTNNDSYLYRRYVNKNGEKVQQSMLRLAEEYNAGVWNMYEVMGGLNSVVLWEKNGLVQRDKIHFTREGYLILGDLFFNALMKNFENYVLNKNQLTERKN